ncbi:MAG TPA: hypothetical protein VD962_03370, partial [Rubricoccaceae bacterium]|nr:hypothetical protein [Rubricoccaceae bacterium]
MRLSATLFRYALRFGVLLAVLPTSARAQTPGSCAPGEAVGTLNVSDVQARLFNGGNLFYGPGYTSGNGYEVPHVLGACGGFLCSPVFAANFWVAGTVSSTLRTAAATYQRFEFWPGPLDPGATLPNPSDCSGYDRIYVVSTTDVETYENGGPATPDLAEWPVGLGAPAVDAMGNPVIPTSREQVINLAAGERPVIHGSQTAFWVMNDVGNVHAESKSAPLGVEVQVLAFAINSTETALNQATVYRYRLINRNSALIDSARVGVWMDSDLGAALDDFIHFDTTRSMMAFYNAANTDVIYGSPPALGIDL